MPRVLIHYMRLMIRSACGSRRTVTGDGYMNKKEQRAQRAREEDIILTKVLWWILGAVVLEVLLLLLNKFYVNYTVDGIEVAVAIQSMFNVLIYVVPAVFAVLLVWALVAYKRGKGYLLPFVLTGIAFVLTVCTVIIWKFYDRGISLLTVAVPTVAVLALIFYLYQREFFFSACLSALGLLGVRMAASAAGNPVIAYGYLALLAVVLLVAVVAFRSMQTHGGALVLKGKKQEILAKSANYVMLYVTCALVAAVVVAAVVLEGLMVLYGVLAAWLLIQAVYYTVRLM